ncbi:M15 family metallopeptidase [Cryobacterium arcticum]|uniref:D-alanyl-D-alanine carboxypeptidase n=1 Tax=Cryobacterium arcticum TaxID=670052 RepID=A0A1B1BPU9_9MICO|nr:M15 family metallopeptidase [Cryobacterium arcticum]ANP74558.1 D-alanyl-D-alanine carboxypeptidase [Cryobacterium arcticum]
MSKTKTLTILSLVLVGALAAGGAVLAALPRDGASASGVLRSADPHVMGAADGLIEEGEAVSPFADDLPAIANLDPDLRAAMQNAARDAIADDIDFVVTSGWRSAAYQQSLLDAAVIEYGSLEAAGQFVLSPEQSRHVTGEAVDIGRTDADSWLSQHGADYGLCQIYANEMWHFELATEPGGDCPEQLPNAAG